MKCKISVIIICYNQEDVVSRAINSVLLQKEFLHELIISDDCSVDRTWSVVSEFAKMHPDKVRPFRNDVNLGMYENLQSMYQNVTGNLILFLSGDDSFGIDLFSKIIRLVEDKLLDPNNDKFSVITDYSIKYPDGSETLVSNKLITLYNPLSLKLRGLVVARAMCESKLVFNARKLNYISRKKGNKFPSALQEGYTDAFPFAFSDSIFHLAYTGNVYYAQIGHLKKIVHKKRERLTRFENYSNDFIKIFRSQLDKYDVRFLEHEEAKYRFLYEPKPLTWGIYCFSVILLVFDPLASRIFKQKLVSFLKLSFFPKRF